MQNSLKQLLAAAIISIGITTSAYAADPSAATTPVNHPCMSEHEAVVANCKNGDPCSAACKAARKAMKQCRMANNLPVRQHSGKGGAMKTKCKTGTSTSSPNGAPNTAAPSTNTPPTK